MLLVIHGMANTKSVSRTVMSGVGNGVAGNLRLQHIQAREEERIHVVILSLSLQLPSIVVRRGAHARPQLGRGAGL